MNRKKNLINYSMFYTFFYLTIAFHFPIIGVLFEDQGFSISQIGILLATAPLMGLFFQTFWGSMADRARNKNSIIVLLIISNSIVFLLFSLISNFQIAIILMLLFNIFQVSVAPVSETSCLELCDSYNVNYGKIRIIGSIAYSIGALFVGYVYDLNKNYVFIIYFILSVLSAIFIYRTPKVKGHQHGIKKISPFSVLKDKKLIYLMLLAFFAHLSFGFHINFQGIYFKQIAGDLTLYGLSNAVLAISEIPFLLIGKKLYLKFGPQKILIAGSFLTSLRWLLVFIADGPIMLILSNMLQGPGYILVVYVVVYYINENVPKTLKASGQAVNAIVAGAITKILGSTLGGSLADSIGIHSMYLWLAAISFTWIIIIYSIYHIFVKKRNSLY